MKQLTSIILLFVAGIISAKAQTTNTFPATGNVGIGTTTPIYRLSIVGLPSSNTFSVSDGLKGILLQGQSPLGGGIIGYYNGAYNDLDIRAQAVIGSQLYLKTTGNVGIGTTTPSEKLSVNGKIRAKEIKVENANWPDYVFADDYKLPTLQETEKHIKENGHLEGIPSAKEVKANGIDLGQMNAKLLQKIEELTLLLIEQNKRLELQETAMRKLELKIKINN